MYKFNCFHVLSLDVHCSWLASLCRHKATTSAFDVLQPFRQAQSLYISLECA